MKKKILDTFTATEVGTLIEELRSDFKIFTEDQKVMKSKIDMMFEELGRQKEDIHLIKVDIRFLKNGVAEIKDIIGGNDKRLVKLEESCLK